MSIKKTFGKYTIVRASALAQSEVLSLLSANVTAKWAQLDHISKEQVAEKILLPMMFSLPVGVKVKIHELLIQQAFKGTDSINLDIEYFQGNMVEYHRLLAQLVFWNLDDFFTFIASALSESQAEIAEEEVL